jgi:hypothetical protein
MAGILAVGCAHPPAPSGQAVNEEILAAEQPVPPSTLPQAALETDGGQAADAGSRVAQWPTPSQLLLEKTRSDELTVDRVEGGAHVRFGTPRGPVHVWCPPDYRAATAGTVVYLHGYFNDVDSAWDEHRLAFQFAQSGKNALFVVPEVPSGRADDVYWKDLAELLREVRRRARLPIPKGPLVALGHSGAYRTLASWLDHPRLAEIILLDGLYGYEDELADWLKIGRRRAVLVAVDTQARTEHFLRRFPQRIHLEELPDNPEALSPQQRGARLLSLATSRFDHLELITGGKVVPLVLRLANLPSR